MEDKSKCIETCKTRKNMKKNFLFLNAISHFGAIHQIGKAAEECSELTTELIKYVILNPTIDIQDITKQIPPIKILEEIADVEIMLDQLKIIFSQKSVDRFKKIKLARLRELILGEVLKKS